ncbi:MAG: hypothetical protein Q9227_007621 [Pyrenula ochraceoflavens]
MADSIRDTALGAFIRLVSNKKLLRFPEEEPGFELPWEAEGAGVASAPAASPTDQENRSPTAAGKDKEVEADSTSDEQPIKETDVEKLSPHNGSPLKRVPSRRLQRITSSTQHLTREPTDVERAEIEKVGSLGRMTTQGTSGGSVISRHSTREQTTPYTLERHEIELEELAQRQESNVIKPQKTSDGIILIDWYTTDDPENPQNFSFGKKLQVCAVIILYTFAVYCASSIYTPSEQGVMEKFNVGQSKASLGLSMYVLGYGVGPLLFSPLSEIPRVGRLWPYIASFGLFVILAVPTALVDNYAGLLVLRFLTGFMGSPCLATGGASMGDIFSFLKLPYGLAIWTAAAFCGPALGPVLSGFAVMAKGWRWSLWEVLWMSGPVFLLMFLTLPETSASNILLRRAQRLRKLTGNPMLKSQSEIDQGSKTFNSVVIESLWRPMQITFQDPSIFFINLYSAYLYGKVCPLHNDPSQLLTSTGIYYSFFEAFPLVYINIYGFNIGEQGAVFLCILVGCVLGIATYCGYIYYYLEPDIMKHGMRPQEHRLVPGCFFVLLLPVGMFLFGWTAREDIHWIVSVIGIGLFCYGAFVL